MLGGALAALAAVPAKVNIMFTEKGGGGTGENILFELAEPAPRDRRKLLFAMGVLHDRGPERKSRSLW